MPWRLTSAAPAVNQPLSPHRCGGRTGCLAACPADRSHRGQRRIAPGGLGSHGPFYKSDLTRTLATRTISSKLEEVYTVVLNAQQQAIQAIRPGVPAHVVDAEARGVIGQAGFGSHFGHGLGHGIGLQIHEGPSLRPESETVLQPGMIVTVEPGIYLPAGAVFESRTTCW